MPVTPSPMRRRSASRSPAQRSRSVRRRLSPRQMTPRRLLFGNSPPRGAPLRRANVSHLRQHNSVAVGINRRGQLVIIQNP